MQGATLGMAWDPWSSKDPPGALPDLTPKPCKLQAYSSLQAFACIVAPTWNTAWPSACFIKLVQAWHSCPSRQKTSPRPPKSSWHVSLCTISCNIFMSCSPLDCELMKGRDLVLPMLFPQSLARDLAQSRCSGHVHKGRMKRVYMSLSSKTMGDRLQQNLCLGQGLKDEGRTLVTMISKALSFFILPGKRRCI